MYDALFLDRLEEGLRACLPGWGLPSEAGLKLVCISENATYRIEDAEKNRSLIFRVHRPGYHSRVEIASELCWLQALDEAAVVSTLTVIPRLDGTLIGEFADGDEIRHVVAFGLLPGTEPAEGEDLVHWFTELGAIHARLHRHARNWQLPQWFSRKTWDFGAMLGHARLWGDWRDAQGLDAEGKIILERTAELLRKKLEAYGRSEDRFGLIHADMRIANLLVEGDRLSVIDFDDCGFSWFLYDFAAAISFIEHEPCIPDLLRAWIAGYRREAPLSDEDCAIIPVFIMLRRLLLTAWIASHSETPTAAAMGPAYTAGTVRLARDFLARQETEFNQVFEI